MGHTFGGEVCFLHYDVVAVVVVNFHVLAVGLEKKEEEKKSADNKIPPMMYEGLLTSGSTRT